MRFLGTAHRTRFGIRRDSTDGALPPLGPASHCVRAVGPPRLLVTLLTAAMLCTGGVIRLWADLPSLRPAPWQSPVISGVTLRLDEGNPRSVRLRFEVCGADVTQIPGTGFPVRFEFDTPIVRVAVHGGLISLALEARVTGAATTVSVWRDPFTPPEPWRIVILIDAERLPTAGGLTLGAWPAFDLTPGLAAASGQVRAVVGVGCDNLHAAPQGPPGAPAGSPQTSYRSALLHE